MARGSLASAVVVDAQGRPVATAGDPGAAAVLEGPGVERTPIPGGGFLVTRAAADDEAWSRFSRAFIHEARSPLNALAIYLELLGTRLSEASPKDRPDATPDRIFAKANDQIRRIEDLFRAFGELWGARGEGTDLAEMLRAACRFSEHEALRHGLQMSYEICAHAPIAAAPGLVADAVVLVLAGALRAPQDTRIHLSLQNVRTQEVELQVDLMQGPGTLVELLRPGAERLRAAGGRVELGDRSISATFMLTGG
jgi:signal transduction histidine kinase